MAVLADYLPCAAARRAVRLEESTARHAIRALAEVLGIAPKPDALALKSDFSLGRVLESRNVTVKDSELSSDGCNALNFGSETVGDFVGIRWENIVVRSAGKAGIEHKDCSTELTTQDLDDDGVDATDLDGYLYISPNKNKAIRPTVQIQSKLTSSTNKTFP